VSAEQLGLDDYRREMADRARNQGMRAVRVADPDAFEAAVREIRAVASFGWTFTADDVRTRLAAPGPELGAAFARLRREGEIESCGYETAKHPAAHGRLIRAWRRAP
jgi:hypothetical protein